VWSAKFRVQIVYLIVYGFVWSVATTQQFIIHLHFGFLTEPHAWEGGWGAAGFRPKLEPKLLGLGLESVVGNGSKGQWKKVMGCEVDGGCGGLGGRSMAHMGGGCLGLTMQN
jgi:hypothetical protein